MSENKPPGFHRCIAGSKNIVMPASAEIVLSGTAAVLALEGGGVRIAIQVNGCPVCLEPLTPEGITLDRIKRAEGLK